VVVSVELSKRQNAVLRALVERYVASATPIASDVLVRYDFPTVSSATIRNDLSALEGAGLIYQPHTSAGRIPSERGYRFFVEHLLPERGLSAGERHTISHQFSQVEDQVDEWLRLASTVLAAASGVAAIVSGASGDAARLRHFELIALDSRRVLLVAITNDASVYQQLAELEPPLVQTELRAEAARLSAAWSDCTAAEIRAAQTPAGTPPSALELTIQEMLAAMLERHDHRQWEIRYHDGLANVLSQPEYYRGGDDTVRRQRVHGLVAIVERGDGVRPLLPEVAQQGTLRVIIGEEQPEELRDVALVLCPYGDDHGSVGVLGVIGPMRLDYSRAINGARYVAGILSALMQEWRGATTPEFKGETSA
jgi:heat-inducible transcriptional repressor